MIPKCFPSERPDLLADLDAGRSGAPLTTAQVAALVGVSTRTVRLDIEAGELLAHRCRATGRRSEYRIPRAAARAYLVHLGVLDERQERQESTTPSTLHTPSLMLEP